MIKLAGVMFKEFNETEESLGYAKKAIEIQSNNSEAYLLMGKIQEKRGNF
jgi:hypothetical protein